MYPDGVIQNPKVKHKKGASVSVIGVWCLLLCFEINKYLESSFYVSNHTTESEKLSATRDCLNT